MNKSELLEKKIDDTLKDKDVIDGEPGGSINNQAALWTVERIRMTDRTITTTLILYYFNWHEPSQQWIEKSIWEMEGPALLNCPVRLLQIKVDAETKFEEWRYEVIKYHESFGPEVQDQKVGLHLIKALENKTR